MLVAPSTCVFKVTCGYFFLNTFSIAAVSFSASAAIISVTVPFTVLLPGVLLPPLLLVVPFGLFVRPLEVLEVPGALDPGVCSGEVVSPPEGAAASLLALKEPGFEPDELGSSIGSGLPLQPVSPPVSNSIVIRKAITREVFFLNIFASSFLSPFCRFSMLSTNFAVVVRKILRL